MAFYKTMSNIEFPSSFGIETKHLLNPVIRRIELYLASQVDAKSFLWESSEILFCAVRSKLEHQKKGHVLASVA